MVDRLRFARHLSLAEIREEGQERLAAATVSAPSSGLRGWVARRYLEAGGVGRVLDRDQPDAPPPWAEGLDPACREVVVGSLDALDAMRAVLLGASRK